MKQAKDIIQARLTEYKEKFRSSQKHYQETCQATKAGFSFDYVKLSETEAKIEVLESVLLEIGHAEKIQGIEKKNQEIGRY